MVLWKICGAWGRHIKPSGSKPFFVWECYQYMTYKIRLGLNPSRNEKPAFPYFGPIPSLNGFKRQSPNLTVGRKQMFNKLEILVLDRLPSRARGHHINKFNNLYVVKASIALEPRSLANNLRCPHWAFAFFGNLERRAYLRPRLILLSH